MTCPEASRRIISRLFRADGDHITDLDIPAFSRPIDAVLWHSAYSNTRAPKHRASRSISRRSPTRCRRPRDGIGSQDLDRIFNPLFTTKSGGMGMGLSICRSVIEAHDGRLWVVGNTPRGAVFQFLLHADTGGSTASASGTVPVAAA